MSRQHSNLQTTLLWQLVTCLPGKFDVEEQLQHRHTKRLDAVGLCVIFFLYVSILWAAGDASSKITGPIEASAIQLLASVVSIYNLYLELLVLPRGTKTAEDDFNVTYGPFGRWVYLTHQTIGILAIHSVVSFVSPFVNERLAYGTYEATPVVGAAGVFVTVQYFNLVFPNIDHKRTCQIWAERGVRFGFIDSTRHILPFVVVVLDLLAKQRNMLLATMPSVLVIMLTNFVYVLAFLSVLHINHAITGSWPYGFMKDLRSLEKWLVFTAVQAGVLSLCSLILCFWPRLVAA
ncbi:unnamed protein product [Durusdinium trenchii]|uniref:Uncharacterized protein n=1 Tax=Durusdinium trenchii TaxID=1381693 RepID=A0ABP0ND18_9DINO